MGASSSSPSVTAPSSQAPAQDEFWLTVKTSTQNKTSRDLARRKWAFRASHGGVTIGKGGGLDRENGAEQSVVMPAFSSTLPNGSNDNTSNNHSNPSTAPSSSAISSLTASSGECLVSDVSMLSEHARFLLAPSLPTSAVGSSTYSTTTNSSPSSFPPSASTSSSPSPSPYSSSSSSMTMSAADIAQSRVFMRSIGRTYHLIGQGGGGGSALGIGGSGTTASSLGPRPLSKGQVVKMGACSMQVTDLCVHARGSSSGLPSSSLQSNPGDSSSSSSSPSAAAQSSSLLQTRTSSSQRPTPHPGAATDLSCYICFDETDSPANRLEPSPCACSKLVHKLCLARWIETRGSRTCSICKSKLPVECTVEPPYLVMQVVRHMRGLRWDGDHEFIISFSSGTRAAQAVTIGKGSDCDVILPDPSLSRVHARVAFANGVFTVEDMASQAGTYIRLQVDEMFPLPLDRVCVFKMGHTIVNVKLRKKKASSLFPMHLWTRRALGQLSGQDVPTTSSSSSSTAIPSHLVAAAIAAQTGISGGVQAGNNTPLLATTAAQQSTIGGRVPASLPLFASTTATTTTAAASIGATTSGSDRSRSRMSLSPRQRMQDEAARNSTTVSSSSSSSSSFATRSSSMIASSVGGSSSSNHLLGPSSAITPTRNYPDRSSDIPLVLLGVGGGAGGGGGGGSAFSSPSSPSSPRGGTILSEGNGGPLAAGAVITTVLRATTVEEEEERAAYFANDFQLSAPSTLILDNDKDVAHYVEAVAYAASLGQAVNPELPLLLVETDDEDNGAGGEGGGMNE